jgi:hypothetical protein
LEAQTCLPKTIYAMPNTGLFRLHQNIASGGPVSSGSRLPQSPSVHLCLHDHLQSDMGRRVLEQVLELWSGKLREINQMEQEMCQYLDWESNVEPSTLK